MCFLCPNSHFFLSSAVSPMHQQQQQQQKNQFNLRKHFPSSFLVSLLTFYSGKKMFFQWKFLWENLFKIGAVEAIFLSWTDGNAMWKNLCLSFNQCWNWLKFIFVLYIDKWIFIVTISLIFVTNIERNKICRIFNKI